MTDDTPTAYRAYLLRLWRSGKGVHAVWHASLEHPHTGERRGFATLASLFAFLEEQTRAGGNTAAIDTTTRQAQHDDTDQ